MRFQDENPNSMKAKAIAHFYQTIALIAKLLIL